MTDRPLQLDCSWCGRLMARGEQPPTHGICDSCYQLAVATFREAQEKLHAHRHEPPAAHG